MGRRPTGRSADAKSAVACAGDRLAPTHARALTLEADGASADEMARALDIPAEAVAPLLEVARAKLARLMQLGPSDARAKCGAAPRE